MRIAIYNCYWNTRGGGERHAGAMAEVLSAQHEVELLGHEPVDVPRLSDVLNLDLSRATYRQWPPVGSAALSSLTSEYDLFINSTFWSNLASRAARSAYLVFFPHLLAPAWRLRLTRFAGSLLRRFSPPACELLEGAYPPERGGLQWTHERSVIRIPRERFKRCRTSLRFAPLGPLPLDESLIGVHGSDVTWQVTGDRLVLDTGSQPTGDVDIEIEALTHIPNEIGTSADSRVLGVCLDLQRRRTLRRFIPKVEARIDGFIERKDPYPLSTYDVIMANSAYTQSWIAKRWGLGSEVLPPPVDTQTFATRESTRKRRIILSVGRFFAGAHCKKHREMIRAFRRICDRGLLPDGWEYHLAGNVHRASPVDRQYYSDVERLAEGYPVTLLPDLPFGELLREYSHAAIFWHATGWGESEARNPERMEHFGLTTCEAMSSGCVPVVIAKAGQLEIVDHGETGFLFHTEAELIRYTSMLMGSFGSRSFRDMSEKARLAAMRYGKESFEERLLGILGSHQLLS